MEKTEIRNTTIEFIQQNEFPDFKFFVKVGNNQHELIVDCPQTNDFKEKAVNVLRENYGIDYEYEKVIFKKI